MKKKKKKSKKKGKKKKENKKKKAKKKEGFQKLTEQIKSLGKERKKEIIKEAKKNGKDGDSIKELEKLLTKPEKQIRTYVTKKDKRKKNIEMKTDLKKEMRPEEALQELISPRRGIDLTILRYLEELPKEQFTALLLVEPTNYSKINYELIRLLINHTQGKGLYITLNRSFDFMKETLKREKIDIEKLIFVDAISKGTGKEASFNPNVEFIESPRDLTALSVAIDEVYVKQKEKPKFLVFDSISTLLIYNDIASVERFIHLVIGKLRDWKMKGVLLMVKSEEHKGVVNSLSQFCDRVLQIL